MQKQVYIAALHGVAGVIGWSAPQSLVACSFARYHARRGSMSSVHDVKNYTLQ
ncbi:hypothetical protein MM221_14995 [Salipaludibacillus sp. LMS25]|uniref:hypothetical protein n=1 Tax=Salipaludibacillus sp. LMS25 TaxID=2924031 RepID=UPI0020D16F65|nr:hypothetical protein [Salipaludibacillus sp. LMS25]UTR13905.1 hypothetical protein MM221_14995 [Salipaludibacillus sp. LMS25]